MAKSMVAAEDGDIVGIFYFISAEKRRLQAEKSTDAQALQRYKNYMQNKRGR